MLPYETYEQIAKTIQRCWNYECGEDCGWYDWDDGFKCGRHKSMALYDQFFEDALEVLKEKTNQI